MCLRSPINPLCTSVFVGIDTANKIENNIHPSSHIQCDVKHFTPPNVTTTTRLQFSGSSWWMYLREKQDRQNEIRTKSTSPRLGSLQKSILPKRAPGCGAESNNSKHSKGCLSGVVCAYVCASMRRLYRHAVPESKLIQATYGRRVLLFCFFFVSFLL